MEPTEDVVRSAACLRGLGSRHSSGSPLEDGVRRAAWRRGLAGRRACGEVRERLLQHCVGSGRGAQELLDREAGSF